MRIKQSFLFTGAIGLIAAVPVIAQDAAPADDAGSTTFFQQFFWSSDPLGLIIIWVLLIMSALSIGFALKLFMTYRRASLLPPETAGAVEAMLSEKKFKDAIEYAKADTSYLGGLIAAALDEASAGYNAMELAIDDVGEFETSRMLRPVEYLNVIGNIAPMLGLFGTVYGMIVAFQQLVAAGGKPEPAALAAGISTALVTTFWGLVVAMPALAAYSLVRNKIDALTIEGITIASNLIKPFKPGPRRSAAPGSGQPQQQAPKSSD
jgi:biopolymer transport protein ExbB